MERSVARLRRYLSTSRTGDGVDGFRFNRPMLRRRRVIAVRAKFGICERVIRFGKSAKLRRRVRLGIAIGMEFLRQTAKSRPDLVSRG
jgi:hypothetical protein